jgi:transcriptional regulator with XRE-family HTH domain
MTVEKYLEWSGWSKSRLAREVGVTRQSVIRWTRGAIPGPRLMCRLGSVTSGRVRPEDFYAGPGARR